ncbi:MAG TPA: NUDIX domain-containing protein [Zeimonas sp.]|nr:NUDIX domain-containing protein [Zeimonas sp.]
MLHPDYRYCPRCAQPLVSGLLSGRERSTCRGCGFTHWNNPAPVVAALVQVGDEILLARNAAWPPKTFALITGFLEAGETPEQGIAREIKEETDLDVQSLSLIGVYDFARKNELIIAYHTIATGRVRLSEELVEYRMIAPERLKPWRFGTGLAVADWLRARGLPVEFVDLPRRTGDAS